MKKETLELIAEVNVKLKEAYGDDFIATNEEESKIIEAMELFVELTGETQA